MTFEELFNIYQDNMEWIKRRLQPKTLEFYGERADQWKQAKYMNFKWFEMMRYYCDEVDVYKIKEQSLPLDVKVDDYDNCPCTGYLDYRNQRFYVYYDDMGAQCFIVCEGHIIPIISMGADEIDWWYEVDYLLDKIGE